MCPTLTFCFKNNTLTLEGNHHVHTEDSKYNDKYKILGSHGLIVRELDS